MIVTTSAPSLLATGDAAALVVKTEARMCLFGRLGLSLGQSSQHRVTTSRVLTGGSVYGINLHLFVFLCSRCCDVVFELPV